MLERVERRPMSDQENRAAVIPLHGLAQPSRDPLHNLLVALAVGEWIDEMLQASLLDLRR